MSEEFFFSRHTQRSDTSPNPESTKYPGVTEEGVELSRNQAQKIVATVEQAPQDAIIFLGGSSEEDRTKSTADVLGDTVAEHFAGRDDVIALTHAELEVLSQKNHDLLASARQIVQENPSKKIFATYPLFLNEFSLRPHFREKDTGNHTELSHELFDKAGGSEEAATTLLMQEAVDLGEATPQNLAESHLNGIKRLRDFIQKLAPGRPVIIGIVGHAWNLDALASYLANEGTANYEGYTQAGEKMIEQSEIGTLTLQNGAMTFSYRDKTFTIPD